MERVNNFSKNYEALYTNELIKYKEIRNISGRR